MLVSYDEYLALRETIDIANDSLLFARIAEADEETRSRPTPADAPAHHAAGQAGLDALTASSAASFSLRS